MKIFAIILIGLILLFAGCTAFDNLINGIDQKKVRDCQEVFYEGKYLGEFFDEDIQGKCFKKLANEENNPNYCNFIPENAGHMEQYGEVDGEEWELNKAECFYEMAVKLNDKSLCDKITKGDWLHNTKKCYAEFE